MATRVPVPDGSLTDMVVSLQEDVTPAQVNEALLQASEQAPLRGILRVTHEALVSRGYHRRSPLIDRRRPLHLDAGKASG